MKVPKLEKKNAPNNKDEARSDTLGLREYDNVTKREQHKADEIWNTALVHKPDGRNGKRTTMMWHEHGFGS